MRYQLQPAPFLRSLLSRKSKAALLCLFVAGAPTPSFTAAQAEEIETMISIKSDTASPEIEVFRQFLQNGASGPVVMLNLLQFRTDAKYEDGRLTDLSGADAYQIYAREMKNLVEGAGGRYLYVGRPVAALIGDSENWDMIALVEYPSIAVFAEITTTPEYQAISIHRKAGLRAQVLTATNDASAFATAE